MIILIIFTLGFQLVSLTEKHSRINFIYNSTVIFVDKFISIKYNKIDCNINDYISDIYFNSFQITNYLGEFYSCSKKNLTFQYFILYNFRKSKQFQKKTLAELIPMLLFEEYYAFAMCLPGCFEILNTEYPTMTFKNESYSLLSFNITNITEKTYNQLDFTELYILLSILLSFLIIGLFFAIFPNYILLKNFIRFCKYSIFFTKVRKYSEFKDVSDENEEELNKECQGKIDGTLLTIKQETIEEIKNYETNKNDKIFEENFGKEVEYNSLIFEPSKKEEKNLYDNLSDIFNLIKSLKRFTVDNQFVNKINSKYRNDNSLGFINGIKSINMILLILNILSFQIFLVPTTNINNYSNINSLEYYIFHVIVRFYMSNCFQMYWCLHGFILGYKFLFHMKTRNATENFKLEAKNGLNKTFFESWNKIKKMFSFLFQQTYLYLIFIYMFLLICNLDKILYKIYYKYNQGTILFIYTDIARRLKEQIVFFVFPVANFMIGNAFEFKEGATMSFLYIFINEIQFFLVSIVVLCLYSKRRNNSYNCVFMIIMYMISLFGKVLNYSLKERTYKMRLGIDEYFWNYSSGFSIYFFGVIMGVLYFEYNTGGITYSRIHSFSSQESLGQSEELNEKNNIKTKLQLIFSKKSCYYIILSMTIFILIYLVDSIMIFPKINKISIDNPIPLLIKIYISLEADFFFYGLFILIFRFVIMRKLSFKEFLERKIWIKIS